MGHSPISGRGRDDRLSHLDDGLLGHIPSFLDADEVGRATALSRRWRDVLAIVHTVSLEEPKPPLSEYGRDIWSGCSPDDTMDPRSFQDAVTGALFARSRRPSPAPAAVPLRALRVSMRVYDADEDKSTVDQWVSYALKHAAPGLELDLRLRCLPACKRPDVTAARPDEDKDKPDVDDHSIRGFSDDDGDDSSSSSEEKFCIPSYLHGDVEYTVPWGLFSCAALRSLRLGSCRLSPPAALNMPFLETLHLTHVPDEEGNVQRLISACPRLADLTLEACGAVTTLSLLHNTRLRRLALRCCHKLATVAVNASELCSFEYRGAVPEDSFITVGGGVVFPSVTSCKVDICAVCVEQATSTSEEALVKLGSFLQKFASAERLHLCSTRMSSCFVGLPAFPALRHLQLHGIVPHDDDDDPAYAAAAATSRILAHAPNLETLSLFFEVKRRDRHAYDYYYFTDNEAVLLDAHHLHYNQYETLNVPVESVPPCLGSQVRKINLLQYQGGRAQRTLARFLLRNAAVLDKLYCGFAGGAWWVQTELMREMEGWVTNETASKEFR